MPKTSLPKIRIVIAVTSPRSCNFYSAVLGRLCRSGFEPILVSAPGPGLEEVSAAAGVRSIAVPMEREISPLRDLTSFCTLYRTLRRLRPAIVDASTPKAGLLITVAAWLARVPCRVYTLRGLRLETTTGVKRALLWMAEWISCHCAHRVVCVSPSLGASAIRLRLVPPHKAVVLDHGNGGVDLDHFSPAWRSAAATQSLRTSLGIAGNSRVMGFVGRFVRDKGIRELIEAFEYLHRKHPDLRLLLVGDFESGDPVEPGIRQFIESSAAILRPGFVADTAPYYGLIDVLVLPTYREGFPAVSLEAQASGVPVVTTFATGAVDSVADGETGFLVPIGDSLALSDAIARLLEDPQLRLRMGEAGRLHMERASTAFSPSGLSSSELSSSESFPDEGASPEDAHVHLYRQLLREKAIAVLSNARRDNSTLREKTGRLAKRIFDVLGAVTALLLLALPLLIVAALVRIFLGSPILFRQSRPGHHGQLFTCLKFRTMINRRDAGGRLLPDADRLTPFGNFLRASSLDELPELINVIRGEMSLVGPRPLLPQYLPRYTPEQMRRHAVKPGITGWAQVNGRNTLDWERKFALDLWYVDHQSLALDLRILAKTVWQVVRCQGIAPRGQQTVPEFLGAAISYKSGAISYTDLVKRGDA